MGSRGSWQACLTYAADYERSIQGAFREVADALAVRETIDDQLDAQEALVAAASDGLRLADARFRGGASSAVTASAGSGPGAR